MSRLIPYIMYFFTRSQKIIIDSIPDGSVIDIGGGGEGIIAQIGNERITAIDKNQSEINEAKPNAPKANWILADATNIRNMSSTLSDIMLIYRFVLQQVS